MELGAARTEEDCFIELLQGQVEVFGVEEGHSPNAVDGGYPEVEFFVFPFDLMGLEVVFESFQKVVGCSIAIPSIREHAPVLVAEGQSLGEQLASLVVLVLFEQKDPHLIVGEGDLAPELPFQRPVLDMLVGQFQIREGQLVFLLGPVQIGTQNQDLGVVGVNFQPPLNFQLAPFQLAVDQVVLGFLVELLELRSDHLNEDLHFRVSLVLAVGVPELLVPLRSLQQAPVEHRPQHYQIHVPLIDHYAVLHLT